MPLIYRRAFCLKSQISRQKMTAYEHHSEPSWKPASLLGGRKWQIYGQINHKEPSGMLNLYWPPRLMKLEQVQLPVQKPKEQSTSSIRHRSSPPRLTRYWIYVLLQLFFALPSVSGEAAELFESRYHSTSLVWRFIREVLSRHASDTQTKNFLSIFSLRPPRFHRKVRLANAASESARGLHCTENHTRLILLGSDSFLFML